MHKIIISLLTFFIIISCKSQEKQKINIKQTHLEINIPGTPGPWLKYNKKYFCYFLTDNDDFSSGSNHHFYIIDENGKINSKVKVPDDLQTFYYDLYVKNDTIFTTEYYDRNTFYLDLNKNKWIKTKKGNDLYYKDKNYTVYALNFGEFGCVTWFENKKTKKQYEIACCNPIINKLNNSYYLTSATSIIKIDNPENLAFSKEPYKYKIAVNKRHYRQGSSSMKGAEILFIHKNDIYSKQHFYIATSFVANNKLYHLYKDSISTKIGILENNKLYPIYTFKSIIKPYSWYYDTRNQIQNNKYQTIQFNTDKQNIYGIIEINGNNVNTIYFKNMYKEPTFKSNEIQKWVENSLNIYFLNIENLKLKTADELEIKVRATDLTQRHKISHYLLDGKDIETPRIYRKKENSNIKLITSYYYTAKEKNIELIEFKWKKTKNFKQHIEEMINPNKNKNDYKIFKTKFEWLSNFIQNKIGKPIKNKIKKQSAEQKWETDNFKLTVSYGNNYLELTMLKK